MVRSLLIIAFALVPLTLRAQSPGFKEHIQPFFAKHCVRCHGEKKAEAKLRLDTLAADFVRRPAADHWVEILDRVNLGEMPPEDEPKPSAEELLKFADWITRELTQVRDKAQSTGGRVQLRRLTRLEYANTVRDLLKLDFPEGQGPLEQLPPDGQIAGFDRLSKALLIDPSLMEAYLNVAQQVADRAVRFRPPTVPQRTLKYEFDDIRFNGAISYQVALRGFQVEEPFLVLMESSARTYGKLRHPSSNTEIPLTGRYRIRVRAAADQGARGEPVYMDITYGPDGRQARFRVDAKRDSPQIYEFEKTFESSVPGEFQVGLANGTRFSEGNAEWYERQNQVNKLAESGKTLESVRLKSRMRAEGEYGENVRGSYLPGVLDLDKLPKLYLDWIEVIGPLQGEYPPPSLEAIFGSTAPHFAGGSVARDTLIADTRAVFARLAPRAFRRPARKEELDRLVKIFEEELAAGAEPQDAIKAGLVALFCSPDFLFLFEPSAADAAVRPLNDFELAARLSYFLWSSMPDEELFKLAAAKKLREPKTLGEQVRRLLADPKSEGFVNGFARQWLKVDEFGRFAPDERIYPEFYATDMAGIEADVKAEPLAFFREALRRDEPVRSFLDSPWLMLNERLAKLYELPGVTGGELRRVTLDGSDAARRRGGLLGMAGVHLWGADGNRTKPVDRGKYILAVMFNDPPPPPPPNAGEVEPNLGGKILTVRERLVAHREQATCNNCHRRIDPYGLALENFNVIGRWREKLDGEKPLAHWGQNRPPIDVSGTLPNGREIADFPAFKAAMLEQEPRFTRALAEKLLTYALGRTLEPSDRGEIERIAAAGKPATLRSLIEGVVTSPTFQRK